MKKSLIVSLLVILIGIGIYLVINQTNTSNSAVSVDTNSNNPLPAKKVAPQQNQAFPQETIKLTATSIDPKSLAEGWQVIALGSGQVSKDDNDFSVNITDLGQTIVPNDPLWGLGCLVRCQTRTTQGKFIQVDFNVNNNSLESEMMDLTPAQVFDQDGRVYGSILGINVCGSNSTAYGYTIYAQNLKPGIPCVMKALYEVSQSSTSFVAKLFYRKGK
jgi:hypothetical protein